MYQQQIQHRDGNKVIQTNRRRAIREKCLNCAAWYYSKVTDCNFEKDCPLWLLRSGQGKQDANKRSRAIRAYCGWCQNGSAFSVAKFNDDQCPLFPYRKGGIDWSANFENKAGNTPYRRRSLG